MRIIGNTWRSPGCRWPRPADVEGVSNHQREQLSYAICSPLCLLTGTPGTGKTYTLASVIRSLLRNGVGRHNIAVAAPTGKAAVRITESLGRQGVRLTARTIHSLLEIGRNGHDGEGWGFQRNRDCPLDQSFVFVDEASMLDVDLCASLMSACKPGTHVMFVGDPNQLAPVGHGAPLRDMIAAGVPWARLSEIHRNAGGIVKACADIKDGKPFHASPGIEWDEVDNLRIVETATPAATIEQVVAFCLAYRKGHVENAGAYEPFAEPLDDVQVILATNTKGPLSRRTVNRAMQESLNPDGQRHEGNPFWTGDKIICLKNGWHLDERTREEDVYVANGEIGRVIHVEPRVVVACFDCPARTIRVPIGKARQSEEDAGGDEVEDAGSGCNFDLGWAITCHRSQGSEWPIVLTLIDDSPGARRICDRHWLYTAISRPSKLGVLYGKLGAAQMMARRAGLAKRKTFLAEKIKATNCV